MLTSHEPVVFLDDCIFSNGCRDLGNGVAAAGIVLPSHQCFDSSFDYVVFGVDLWNNWGSRRIFHYICGDLVLLSNLFIETSGGEGWRVGKAYSPTSGICAVCLVDLQSQFFLAR